MRYVPPICSTSIFIFSFGSFLFAFFAAFQLWFQKQLRSFLKSGAKVQKKLRSNK